MDIAKDWNEYRVRRNVSIAISRSRTAAPSTILVGTNKRLNKIFGGINYCNEEN